MVFCCRRERPGTGGGVKVGLDEIIGMILRTNFGSVKPMLFVASHVYPAGCRNGFELTPKVMTFCYISCTSRVTMMLPSMRTGV